MWSRSIKCIAIDEARETKKRNVHIQQIIFTSELAKNLKSFKRSSNLSWSTEVAYNSNSFKEVPKLGDFKSYICLKQFRDRNQLLVNVLPLEILYYDSSMKLTLQERFKRERADISNKRCEIAIP